MGTFSRPPVLGVVLVHACGEAADLVGGFGAFGGGWGTQFHMASPSRGIWQALVEVVTSPLRALVSAPHRSANTRVVLEFRGG